MEEVSSLTEVPPDLYCRRTVTSGSPSRAWKKQGEMLKLKGTFRQEGACTGLTLRNKQDSEHLQGYLHGPRPPTQGKPHHARPDSVLCRENDKVFLTSNLTSLLVLKVLPL